MVRKWLVLRKQKTGGGSEEVEKDKDCSENIVTIGDPMAETSENMVVDVEDLRDERYGFVVGDFGWGLAKSKPCWPGRIYDPSDAYDDALKQEQKNRPLVTYFGHGTFAWCHPSQLKRFGDNIDERVKQSSSIDFANGVQEATSEVGRLLFMKLSLLVVDK
ncbi:PWWP domain-containing protein 3-like [Vigna angularis]|uniref:PWWP domain-containing protein 3-like n=1 Tax=Phaseolus angularis TaxID=3914 RepID=UPI00080A570C|nr:PWWP domain-containing protein 3-like [Vigna angularis]